MATAGLRTTLGLFRKQAGLLLHPPGASPYLALMLAVAGFEVALNTPSTASEVLAMRTLGTGGIAAWASALQAIPEPSRGAIASAVLLALLCLFTLGGWINVALSLVRGEAPSARVWNAGLAQSGRALFWLGLVTLLVASGVLGVGAVSAGVLRAWFLGYAGGGLSSLAWPIAATCGFMVTLLAGLYVLGTSYLMGVVAVAEPETPFFGIPARSRALFKAGPGDRFFSRMVVLVVGWFALKLFLLQLLVPFPGTPEGVARLLPVVGSILNGSLTLLDGLVALVGIVLAVHVYQEGLERLSETAG